MLPEFNVHCGQVLRGHDLHLTGLRVDGTSDDSMHADYSEHQPGKPVHPMVSLTYIFTPGLASDDLPDGRGIDVEVTLEPPAEPAFWPSVMQGGGEREVAMGGESTQGAFGPFVLPDATRTVAFDLYQFGVTSNGVGPPDDSPERVLGTLVVDLETQKATWTSPPG